MGAIRFTGELQSRRGVLYAIEIWDESYASTSTDIRLSGDGFRLQYDAVGDSRTTPIIASRLTFGWQIRNATDEAFITDLLTAAEGRFTIKVTRNTVLFWVGYIQPDISILQDLAYPYRFDVTATDGLGRLKNFDYTTSGQTTFISHILNCLTQDVLAARYFNASSDIFLRTSVNWFHTQHGSPTTTKDPLLLSRFDGIIFQRSKDDGTTDYDNCLTVLSEILTTWNARIYFSAGSYHVEQPDYRLTDTFNERRYARDATQVSTSAVNYSRSLPQSLTGAKQRGVTFDWFPPLKYAEVKYAHRTARNWLDGYTFGSAIVLHGAVTPGISDVGASAYCKVTGTARIKMTPDAADPFYATISMSLKIGSSKALKRTVAGASGSLTYSAISWSNTTTDKVAISTDPLYPTVASPMDIAIPFTIYSPTVPVSGSLVIDFTLGTPKKMATDTTASVTTNEWTIDNLVWEILDTNTASNFLTDNIYHVDNTTSGNSETAIVTTRIGEMVRVVTPGKVQTTSDSVTWVDTTTGWTESGLGISYAIGKLLARAIMSGQKTPVQKMHGTIFGDDFYFHNLVSDLSSRKWLFLGGTFTAKSDEWAVEMWGVSYSATTGGTIKYLNNFSTAAVGTGGSINPEKTQKTDPATFVFSAISNSQSTAAASSGATTISVAAMKAGAFVLNEKVKIINPTTGEVVSATVSATNAANATSISFTSALGTAMPQGAYIVKDGQAATLSGNPGGNGIYGGSGALSANTVVDHSSSGYTLTLDSSADTSTPETLILKGNTSGTSTKGLKITNQANTELAYLQSISGGAEVRLGTGTAVKLVLIGIGGTDIYADTKLVMAANTDGSVTLFGVTSEPGSPAEGSFWYNTTDNVLRLRRGSTTEIVKTGGTDASSGAATYTPGGADYTLILDANSNAITVTLGASMHEGMDYLIRCRRNGTNIITFNSDSGYTLTIDTVSTLNPTTFTAGGSGVGIYAPHKTYTMRRAGSVIHIR